MMVFAKSLEVGIIQWMWEPPTIGIEGIITVDPFDMVTNCGRSYHPLFLAFHTERVLS